jgi:putative addiction module component (TIGR02574 family)
MTNAAKKLSAAARDLPVGERLELVEDLLDSLDASDAAVDRLWAREAEERLAAYRRGEIGASGLSDVLAKYKSS